ncbi:MAG TPA: glycosyl hydrolase [Spongiibacteraceae bacterium]|nr:glycosyl hydrolase [Spongiibacteraceae bacterium]
MLKRILTWLAVAVGVLLIVAGIGIAWYVHATKAHLVPPPDPAGQKSIATYATHEREPVAKPELVKDFSWDSIAQPPKSARPWTRWWWPGGDVDVAVLLKQLDLLDAANFGGGEVQPFLSGMMTIKDPQVMENVYSFDKPAYYEKLNALMAGAAERGLQIDLTHFSGWPPGGPEINLEDSLTDIVYGEAEVSGGKTLSIQLPKPKPGPSEYIFSNIEFAGADFINFPAAHARVLSVLAVKKTSGEHSWNVFNLNDAETLDPKSTQVLTSSVKDGVLTWNAPAGDWQIIASYIMPSGEVPMGAAQKPQGFVVDHLRKPQVLGHYEYAFGARTGLQGDYGKGFRGIFNDSLEFRLKRMSVEDILQEFKARRGYDLEPYLPALYIEGIDNVYFREILGIHAGPEFHLTPLDERIRRDYQLTLSDLIIERFVETSARWAETRGLTSRAQSYGMDIDILRALGANTIPESEQLWAGGSDLGLKMASSAAALYGKPLVSAESFVWVNRDYTTTARKIKAAADKELLAGINHIIYHGTPYPWRGGDPSPFGEEGWAPFSGPKNPAHFSSIAGPGNTALWPDLAALNNYIARSQNLLRQGSPSVDVLVYYPFLGFDGSNVAGKNPEALLNGSLPDADSRQTAIEAPELTKGKQMLSRVLHLQNAPKDERAEWVSQMVPLLQELDRRCITWSWVNAHAIESGKVGNGVLTASNGRYQTLLLPNVKAIDQSTLQSLAQLSSAGVPIYFAGLLPMQQPGFKDAAQGDSAVVTLTQKVLDSGARQVGFDVSQLAETLQTQLRQSIRYDQPSTIRNYRRDLGGGNFIYFFANQNAAAASVKLHIALKQPLWWFDAEQGVALPVSNRSETVDLALNGFESRFLIAGIPMPTTLPVQVPDSIGFQLAVNKWPLTDWDIKLDNYSQKLESLPDWRDIPALQYARGPALYTKHFVLKAKVSDARYLLNLGLVQGSALVKVNGTEIGRASIPPFIVDISTALQTGDNLIEVQLLAPLRNYFVGRALAEDPKYSHMKGYANQLVAAGLMGPVTIAEATSSPAQR